jgi:proteic killer suppression protein
MPIRSFRDADTQRLFSGERVKRFMGFETVAMRKLAMLSRAGRLDDLRVPPGNRLEALKGGRAGQYGIRINDQCRICFAWTPDGPKDVEIVDYH